MQKRKRIEEEWNLEAPAGDVRQRKNDFLSCSVGCFCSPRCFTWQTEKQAEGEWPPTGHTLIWSTLAGVGSCASTHLSSNHLPKMSASMASLCLGLNRNSETSSGECSSGSQSPSSPRDRKTWWNCSYTYESALKSKEMKMCDLFLSFMWFEVGFEAAV